MFASIKQLLAKYYIKPSKKLGQHFLINKNVLQKIIEAANLSEQDTVLEIGPGIGALTLELAKKAKKVITVEKDEKMCQILETVLQNQQIKNVKIINQNILDYKVKTKNYKLIANLPYYIAAPIIRKFLEEESQPQKMVLMIQKEVAQRIVAKQGKMSILAVSVQFYAEPKIIAYVPKEAFWPKPQVDSAIINIKPYAKKQNSHFIHHFFKLVKAGFSAPRKQLANNLAKNLNIDRPKIENILRQCGLDPKQRAETLTVDNWEKLSLLIHKNKV